MTVMAGYFNAAYFTRGLTCSIGLTNDLIDGGQPKICRSCKLEPTARIKLDMDM